MFTQWLVLTEGVNINLPPPYPWPGLGSVTEDHCILYLQFGQILPPVPSQQIELFYFAKSREQFANIIYSDAGFKPCYLLSSCINLSRESVVNIQ